MDPDIIPVAPVAAVAPEDEFADAFAAIAAATPIEPAIVEPAVVEPAVVEPAVVEPAVVEPAPVEDPMAQLEAARAEIAALKATPAPVAAAPAPVVAPTPEAPAEVYNADETAMLEKYKEDWPDILKGEALIRRAEYRELVSYIFDQVSRQYAPMQEHYQGSSVRTQYSDIVSLVPDYDDVRDKALAWIETQPAYLKTAYQTVASEGTPQDVADLITRYKKETGIAIPAGSQVQSAPVVPAAVKPAATELTPAAKKAAASLSVVKSSRGEQTAGADPNDFDSAFKEFASAK